MKFVIDSQALHFLSYCLKANSKLFSQPYMTSQCSCAKFQCESKELKKELGSEKILKAFRTDFALQSVDGEPIMVDTQRLSPL